MSNRNNDVFQVLVTKGDQALLAAGNTVDALAVGQIGIFDANTHLSVLGTAPREFYFAVGVNTSGGSTLEDIKESAGQYIQTKNILNNSFRAHSAGRPMIVKVGDYKVECETDYTVRVEFRNSRIGKLQGYNQYSKAYSVRTSCCDCASGCGSGDANELTNLLVNAINIDQNGFMTAAPIARQALTILTHATSADYSAGDVMTEADVNALITFNAAQADAADKVYSDIQLTSEPIKLKNFCDVNLGFHKFTQTYLVVSLVEGFNCTGKVETIQELAYEEGTGNNIRQKEYHATGWYGKGPYVASSVTGMSFGEIDYIAVKDEKYDQFILEYDFKSHSGWKEYENALSTIIAVPETDTTTRASLAGAIDAITGTQIFEALADDAAAANVDPDVVEAQPADDTKDGVA